MNLYPPHFVQSKQWGEFKKAMGTPPIRVGKTLFTKHPIPCTKHFAGYCPRVNPENLDLEALSKAGHENQCTHIKLDVPNAPNTYEIQNTKSKLQETSPTFATSTFLTDLTKSEEELLAAMHHKTRYNIRLSDRKGVRVEESNDIDTFIELHQQTAQRQNFFTHPGEYFSTLWQQFNPQGMAALLEAQHKGTVLGSYFLIRYQNTFYYVYGGSSTKHRNLMANNLLMWEAMLLGKRRGCLIFDLFGCLDEPASEDDPWYGFHRFKKGFGGTHVSYPHGWDVIINPTAYKLFILANNLRWKLLRSIK